MRWVLSDETVDRVSRAREWEEVAPPDGARLLKENRLRTVLLGARDPATGRPYIIKRYRHLKTRERLRHVLFPSHAEREYRALGRLTRWELPVPRPLGFGLLRRAGVVVEGALVMEAIESADVLGETFASLESGEPERLRRCLVTAGLLVRALHERGVHHPDLHAGNFLLRPTDRGDELFLIDFHSCRFPGLLPRAARLRGLARIAESFPGTLESGEFRWLLAGYFHPSWRSAIERGAGATWNSPLDGHPGELEAALGRAGGDTLRHVERAHEAMRQIVARLGRRRLRSRTRRCLLESSVFCVRRGDGRRVLRRRTFEADAWLAQLTGEPAGEVLKPGSNRWVARVRPPEELESGSREAAAVTRGGSSNGRSDGARPGLVVKYRRYSLARSLVSPLVGHPLRRAWIGAHGLSVRGLPAAEGQALVERRVLGLTREAWLVSQALEGEPLDRWLWRRYGEESGAAMPPASRESATTATGAKFAASRAAGALLRRFHDAAVAHRDLSPHNWLIRVSPSGSHVEIFVVDTDDVRFRQVLSWPVRRRQLVQLGNLPQGHVFTTDLARALIAYDGGRGDAWRREAVAELRIGLIGEAWKTLLRVMRYGSTRSARRWSDDSEHE